MNGYSLDQKTGSLYVGSYKQNGDLFEKGSDDFDYNWVICGDHLPEQNCAGGIFR